MAGLLRSQLIVGTRQLPLARQTTKVLGHLLALTHTNYEKPQAHYKWLKNTSSWPSSPALTTSGAEPFGYTTLLLYPLGKCQKGWLNVAMRLIKMAELRGCELATRE